MSAELIITIIGSVLVCGGFWTFLQYMINRHDDKNKAMRELKDAIAKLQKDVDTNNVQMALQNEALMSIAQDRIVYIGQAYIRQGWVTFNDYATLKRMADAYKAMGGNSLAKDVMLQVDKLERRA